MTQTEVGFARMQKEEMMSDISNSCDFCIDKNCMTCPCGNPCLGCEDYDNENDTCKSNGGCASERRTDE